MIDRERFVKACEKMGCQYVNSEHFVAYAMGWLAVKIGDLHVEYHAEQGWQVSTCYAGDDWGYDSWLRAEDGSLAGALLLAVEKVEK